MRRCWLGKGGNLSQMETALSLDSQVSISKDVLFQELQGEAVLLNLATGVYLGLDPVGTRIWQLMEAHQSLRKVLEAMVAQYEVTEERCAEDLLKLVEQMR